MPAEWTPDLRWALRRVTVAGCLAMIWVEFTGGGPFVDFIKKLGGREFEFGILGAIPPAMLLLQFVSGLMVQQLQARKPLWITLMVAHRAVPALIAFVPWVFPGGGRNWIWAIVGLIAVSEGLANCAVPMWFAWMGDLVPPGSMGEFWARRRRWLMLSSAATLLASALFFKALAREDIRLLYLVVALVGSIAGVWDILLFLRIPEPRMARESAPEPRLLLAPFRDPTFRRFILFWCYWSFAVTFSFPFFRLYMLNSLELSVDNINLLFVFHALGGMLLADRFGRLGDRVGLRPVIIMCVLLKSAIVLAFLFSRPGWRVLVLLPFFTLDNMINTGLLTSHSTYMLKFSPRNNRTMYVAAVLATSGLAGAAASLSSGLLLQCLRDQTWRFLGEEWNHFHAVFAVGVALRLLAIPVATIIKEPKSQPADKVITEIVGPAVLRRLVLPVEYLWPFGK